MKIGHITTDYKPIIGGAEVYIDQLINILKEAGYEQEVYQLARDTQSPELIQLPKIKGLPKLVNYSALLPCYFRQLLQDDVLIINYPQYYFPVFWHPRSIVLSHGATWTSLENKSLRKFIVSIFRLTYEKARAAVFNDTFVLREIGLDIKPGEHIFQKVDHNKWFIPNCVDTNTFKPIVSRQELLDKKMIVVPRNITFGRGIDLAIKAFAIFSRAHPGYKLGLIGSKEHLDDEQNKYFTMLLNLINKLNIDKSVLFLGHYPNNKMPELLSSAVMSLIPTRHREGTSLSALESMACKTPTISTDIEGLMDLPTLKCKCNEISMAVAMEQVVNNRDIIARSQFENTVSTYNITNWAQAWLKVIEEVIHGKFI